MLILGRFYYTSRLKLVLDWYHHFLNHLDMCDEEFTFLTSIGICQHLFFLYHSSMYTMQEFSYLGRITLVSIWFRMVLTQIIAWLHKDSLTLPCPPNINMLVVGQY